MPQRIFIFGATGSGKTTFASNLSKKLKIPYYTTDNFIYKNNNKWNKKYTEKQRKLKVKNVSNKKNWIIEGVHGGDWLLPAFKKANYVIQLKIKKPILLHRVTKRYFKRKKLHYESPKDLIKMVYWSLIYYPWGNYRDHKKLVKKYNKELVILNSKKQVEKFLENPIFN